MEPSIFNSLVMTYFHMGTPTLSSAMLRFTSEFDMGSGGTKALLSPGKLVKVKANVAQTF